MEAEKKTEPVKSAPQVLPDKTLHESATEFLLRAVRDKSDDIHLQAQAQRHLEAIHSVDAAEATENLKKHFPSSDGTVFITSLPNHKQSVKGGKVSAASHDEAAGKIVAGTHKVSTDEEVKQFKTDEEAKSKAAHEQRVAEAKATLARLEAEGKSGIMLPPGATASAGATGAPHSAEPRTTGMLPGDPLWKQTAAGQQAAPAGPAPIK